MITLIKGQKIVDYDDIVIMNDGEFNDTDLVAFCNIDNDGVEVTSFQADFVASRLA